MVSALWDLKSMLAILSDAVQSLEIYSMLVKAEETAKNYIEF